ncbi:exodeoxyribonuclease VII small subunit [Arcanobacterium hippocoleae]
MNTNNLMPAPTAAQLEENAANLSYEEARAKLVEIVSRLEQGNIPLEEAITLWELGEALARRCESWLDGARERLAKAQARAAAASNDFHGSNAENTEKRQSVNIENQEA